MAYDPDRDYGLDYEFEPTEGDAWNELTREEFSLYMTDPGVGLDDEGGAR